MSAGRHHAAAGAPADPAGRDRDALALPHTDWLRHDLVVSGPAAAVTTFRCAAAGAGVIPWQLPELDRDEEDRMHALMHPPDGSPGLRLAAARVLARQLHSAIESHHNRVLAAVGRDRRCPLDLQALRPLPDSVLRLGPDDPVSLAWLRTHWGVIQPLRHVRLRDAASDRRLRRSARLHYEFWSADWTPWPAVRALRNAWPSLVYDVQPHYGDG